MFGHEIISITTRYGRMFVPERDTVIGRSLRLYGEWAENEIRYISQFLKNGPAILDVGANIGTHALAFSAMFPASRVLAFEPQSLCHALLSANLIVNGYQNGEPYAIACSDRNGLLHLNPDYESVGWNFGAVSTTKSGDKAYGQPVVISRVDACVVVDSLQLIKIDVEGAEAAVLRGAEKLIRRFAPLIYFEVLRLESMIECGEWLRSVGYELFWLETSAFNPRNYAHCTENVWAASEMGVIAAPAGGAWKIDLPKVTGAEKAIPWSTSLI